MDIDEFNETYIECIVDTYGRCFGMAMAALEYLLFHKDKSIPIIVYFAIMQFAAVEYGKAFRGQDVTIDGITFTYKLKLVDEELFLTEDERLAHNRLLVSRDKIHAHHDSSIYDYSHKENKTEQIVEPPSNNHINPIYIFEHSKKEKRSKWLSSPKELEYMIRQGFNPELMKETISEVGKNSLLIKKIQDSLYEKGLKFHEKEKKVFIYKLNWP